jgi:hypothetical protein
MHAQHFNDLNVIAPLNPRPHTLSHTLHASADTRKGVDQKVLHRSTALLHGTGKSV